ncbi:hypothetical protein EQG49_04350 [Periweissella cryptocerci]|uniref:Uncharacterized protein n=1 Tax=Periweissella cryptocerci TaxID=2506420 RepID=A0A4P6YSV3_9LACO|nr:hypothetical protein [Periweissella cryptocerci]QBO35746.1 hypothetical protein EQG49_04350 [Periweissella cryptocerci]
MWQDIKLEKVDGIEKLVGEYVIWMQEILPYGKMKIRIYEDQDGQYTGSTDVRILNRIDGSPQGGLGYGDSIDRTLEDTVNNFLDLVMDHDVNHKIQNLAENEIEYSTPSDF